MVGVTGIGSGIDIDGIVASMVAAERAPKESQLSSLEKKTTTQITAIGALKSAISDFQTALGALNKPELFQARSSTSSKPDLVGVRASPAASAGSYQVEVQSLAASSKVALAAFDSADRFSSGALSITLGGLNGDAALAESFTVKVDESNNTLAGLRDAINSAGKEVGVSATVVTDDQGSRLVLSSSKTGAGRDISVAVPEDQAEAGLESLAKLASDAVINPPEAGAKVLETARSALLLVDGLEITSATNTVEGVIEGVTLDLKAETSPGKITIEVAEDKAGVKKQIQSFVDAYNKLIGVINSQTKVTAVGEGKAPVTGALVGDPTARSLLSTIRNELVNPQGNGALRALTDLGITTQKDGTLKIEDVKLQKVLDNNFAELPALFAGGSGIASRLDEKLKPYTQTGGILEQRNKAMTETISDIDKQKENLARRVASLQERLYKQFNAMDMLVGQLSSTSSSLLASLENLPWAANSSKK